MSKERTLAIIKPHMLIDFGEKTLIVIVDVFDFYLKAELAIVAMKVLKFSKVNSMLNG